MLLFLLQVTLSRLCEQDKILQELEFRLSGLKDDKVRNILLLFWSGCMGMSVLISLFFLSRTSLSLFWMCPTSRWSSTRISRLTLRRSPTNSDFFKRTWCIFELTFLECQRWVYYVIIDLQCFLSPFTYNIKYVHSLNRLSYVGSQVV